jgi:hypothetical protein
VLVAVWSRREALRIRLIQQVRERGEIGRGLTLIGTYVSCYLLALLVLWSIGNNDPINTRFVAPVYPFAIALGLWLHSSMGEPKQARWPRVALLIVVLAIAAPNTVKSLKLLGESPGEQLIEVRVHETRTGTWRSSIEWDRPVMRKTRRP